MKQYEYCCIVRISRQIRLGTVAVEGRASVRVPVFFEGQLAHRQGSTRHHQENAPAFSKRKIGTRLPVGVPHIRQFPPDSLPLKLLQRLEIAEVADGVRVAPPAVPEAGDECAVGGGGDEIGAFRGGAAFPCASYMFAAVFPADRRRIFPEKPYGRARFPVAKASFPVYID